MVWFFIVLFPDINECATANICGAFRLCTNIAGSFQCQAGKYNQFCFRCFVICVYYVNVRAIRSGGTVVYSHHTIVFRAAVSIPTPCYSRVSLTENQS